ncbi:MAG: RNase adapter RapZ [Pseudomonadota bacterium]
MKLIVVSGLSGSGKTIALQALEDMGIYCIDNLPFKLLPSLATHMQNAVRLQEKDAAVGIDARNLADDFEAFPEILAQVRAQGIKCEIIFLTADDNTLLKRFSETRRKHPLSSASVPLNEAIKAERALLAPVASDTDWHLDTSHTTVHQLRALVRERLGHSKDRLSLLFLSFGYKHGLPPDADFVFDARCLPNPYWEPRLRPYTGRDPEVVAFLEQQPAVIRMYDSIRAYLEEWIPGFEAENRSYMTVAVGCTGGYHRSVYLVERLARHFSEQRGPVLARHRELP